MTKYTHQIGEHVVTVDDIPRDDPDVESVNLLLHALRMEGREPTVVPHSEYVQMEDRGYRDYVVVEDETWKRWVAS